MKNAAVSHPFACQNDVEFNFRDGRSIYGNVRGGAGTKLANKHIAQFIRDPLTLPKRCVAAGCSNTTANNVSLHKFPKDV